MTLLRGSKGLQSLPPMNPGRPHGQSAHGVEVLRDNVGPGPVDGTTVASTYRWGATETLVRTFALPLGELVDGDNVIAVALVNGSGSGDASFDLGLRQWIRP